MRRALWLLAFVSVIGCSSGSQNEQAGAQNSATAEGTSNVVGTSVAGVTAETRAMIQQATELVAKRDFGKAFEQLNAAIKTDPKCAAAYFMRAGIFADAHQNARAIADFNQAIGLQPQNADFYNARGFYLLTRQQYPVAIQDFSTALKLQPQHPQATNNRGLAYVATGQFKAAVTDFTTAIQVNPKNFDALNNRGFAYFQAGEFDQALADFDNALELNSNCINAYNNKGLLHYKTEKYDLAVEDFTNAIQRDRLNAKYYRHRREAYLKSGQDTQAKNDLARINWLQELARLNQVALRSPRDVDAWIEHGLHLVKGAEYDAAARDFERALKIDPKCAAAHLGWAQLYLKQNKPQEAIVACGKAAELGAIAEAESIRGDIYLKLNQLDAAIAAYESAERFDSKVAEAYLLRAQARQAQGQTDQAEADRRHAIALDPSLGTARQ